MRQAFGILQSRLVEIDLFLQFIGRIQRRRSAFRDYAEAVSSLPVLKACAILMLYNLMESCVRTAFSEIYESVSAESLKFSGVSEELRGLWLQQKMDGAVVPESANRDTYLEALRLVAQSISVQETILIDSRSLPVSGNLDADRIRKLCAKHGVILKVPKWAKGGWQLATIKDQRNALSHGHKSFSECGREYEVDDLKRITKQTVHFLKGMLNSLQRYQDATLYRARIDVA